MTYLIVAWVLVYLVATSEAGLWWLGSIQRIGWLRAAKRNGAMMAEIQAQAMRGLVATVQTMMGLAVGVLSLLQVPWRGPVSIVLLMAIAVMTMILRHLELLQRPKIERLYGLEYKSLAALLTGASLNFWSRVRNVRSKKGSDA